MLVVSQTPRGALSARSRRLSSSATHHPNSPLFSTLTKPNFILTKTTRQKPLNLTLSKASSPDEAKTTTTTSSAPKLDNNNEIQLVGQENVPLEGVIQFEKSGLDFSQRLNKWGRVALLAGGDVLALLLFSAIGRFSHGFTVFDFETLRTADPFIAGWFLSAYFLGGYGKDGRGINGWSKGVASAAKSWALGIPLGLVIRGTLSGHIPQYNFILVTLGSTAVFLIGWRAILLSIFPIDVSKKSDVYRQGSPFELFELLTSLVRRW